MSHVGIRQEVPVSAAIERALTEITQKVGIMGELRSIANVTAKNLTVTVKY